MRRIVPVWVRAGTEQVMVHWDGCRPCSEILAERLQLLYVHKEVFFWLTQHWDAFRISRFYF